MSARVVVDVSAPIPAFEQVRAQLAGHVATGVLAPGDRLPSARALAADLGLAVGTVARAYRELEAQGVVVSRRRVGTVVAEPAGGAPDRALLAAVAVLVARARAAGMADERLVDLVRGSLTARPESQGR